MGDAFRRLSLPDQAFNGGSYTCTYDLDGTDYKQLSLLGGFYQCDACMAQPQVPTRTGRLPTTSFAVAEVIKVMALQRTTDIGPIRFNFRQTENLRIAGDRLQNLLTDLNAAIVVLKEYAANAGDARPLQKVDAVYQGDYARNGSKAGQARSSSACRAHPHFVEPSCPYLCRGGRR